MSVVPMKRFFTTPSARVDESRINSAKVSGCANRATNLIPACNPGFRPSGLSFGNSLNGPTIFPNVPDACPLISYPIHHDKIIYLRVFGYTPFGLPFAIQMSCVFRILAANHEDTRQGAHMPFQIDNFEMAIFCRSGLPVVFPTNDNISPPRMVSVFVKMTGPKLKFDAVKFTSASGGAIRQMHLDMLDMET